MYEIFFSDKYWESYTADVSRHACGSSWKCPLSRQGKFVPMSKQLSTTPWIIWRNGWIDPRVLDLSTSLRWVVSCTPRPLYSRGKIPLYPLDRRVGGPKAGLHDVENRKFLTILALELRPLGLPARSQSLYRLRYPEYCWSILTKTGTCQQILVKLPTSRDIGFSDSVHRPDFP
jgi:hypothetical protein